MEHQVTNESASFNLIYPFTFVCCNDPFHSKQLTNTKCMSQIPYTMRHTYVYLTKRLNMLLNPGQSESEKFWPGIFSVNDAMQQVNRSRIKPNLTLRLCIGSLCI